MSSLADLDAAEAPDGADEILAADPDETSEAPGALTCPECGETFKAPGLLGLHRWRKHGIQGKRDHKRKGGPKVDASPKRTTTATGPGNESESARQKRRRQLIRETLVELVDFQDALAGLDTGEPDRLAAVIRRDADKIANALAWTAEKWNPLGRGVDLLLGHGGPLTIARGFMGVGRFILGRWRAAANARVEAEGVSAEQMAEQLRETYGDPTENRSYLVH